MHMEINSVEFRGSFDGAGRYGTDGRSNLRTYIHTQIGMYVKPNKSRSTT